MDKIPITTGIIGHRDAQITEDHKALVKNIFKELHRRYPHSPVVLFSQLATGADTFVADWFLEVKQELQADFRLIGVLPYDRAYYERSQFSTDAERQHFNEVINQSERLIVLEQLPEDLKKKWEKHPDIHLQELNPYYRHGGEFVADGSMILIALWDEKDNKLEGGTANTVRYKKTGSYKSFVTDHIFDKDGDLISIPCNRKGENRSISLPENPLEKLLANNVAVRKTLEHTESLNIQITRTEKKAIQISASYLLSEKISLQSEDAVLRNLYAVADTLALKYRNRYKRILNLLFILGFVIFSVFEAYKHLGLYKDLFFTTIGLIGFAYGIFKYSIKWKNHKKYLEYRIFAEALRVQFFWNFSGIRKPVTSYILRLHKKEYNWLQHILNAVFAYTFTGHPFPPQQIKIVKKNWVEDQKDYFKHKVNENKKFKKEYDLLTYIVLGLGLLLLIGVYILNWYDEYSHLIHWLIVTDSVLFGLFALMKAYYEKRGYKETLTQYELMRDIFIASDIKINEILSYNGIFANEKDKVLQEILELTGKEALIENGNWYMIYKEKEPEMEGIG